MLKGLKVHNFKSFLNTELKFGQRHLLIGQNNTGKTTLAKLLQFVALSATTDLDQAANTVPGGIEEICNWHLKSDTIDISCFCAIEFEGTTLDYVYDLRLARAASTSPPFGKQLTLRVLSERLSVRIGSKEFVLLERDKHEAAMLHETDAIAGTTSAQRLRIQVPTHVTMLSRLLELGTNPRTVLFRTYLGNWRYFSLNPLAMRYGFGEGGRTGAAAPTDGLLFHWWTSCDPAGSSLSNAIFQLKNYDDVRYRRILRHVQMIEPSLAAITSPRLDRILCHSSR